MAGAATAWARRQLRQAVPAVHHRLAADCAVCCQPAPARRVLHLTQCPQQPQTAKDEPVQMIAIERRLPVNDAADPACPDGRLLALRCLGIP